MYVILFLFLSLPVQQTEPIAPPRSANESTAYKTKTAQGYIAAKTPNTLHIDTSGSEPQGKTEEDKREEAHEKWLYHLYEWATIAGVIGGWFVLLIVRKQGQAIINSERAWVMAELEWAPMFGSITRTRDATGQPASVITMRLRYCNDGNTPAWIDEIKARFEIVERPEKRPSIKSMERIKSGVLDYGPVPLKIRGKDYVDFSLECAGQEEIGKMNILYGVIYYRDAFKKKRRTFFGFRLLDSQIIYLPKYPAYNKNT